MEVINGILYHAVGASSASLCYTPQKKVRLWSWQTYWLAQAAVCWLILPVAVAFLTIPHLSAVLAEAPSTAMYRSFLLGMAYGVGGTAFGIAIRYVGFSLTYAISVGISCVLGTLIPPVINGTFSQILESNGATGIFSGVAMGALGIALCGVAGRSKEKDIEKKQAVKAEFSLSKGLPLCLLAGVLSAFYSFSLDQASPVATIAEKYGAGELKENVKYLFSNTGAFVTTLLYCLYLHSRHRTWKEYGSAGSGLGKNYVMAVLTGILWYGQFFFYGLGHVRMEAGGYGFSSWAIHMIMLVLFSSIAGLLLREWNGCSSRTIRLLVLALFVLVIAVLLLTYGNYIAQET